MIAERALKPYPPAGVDIVDTSDGGSMTPFADDFNDNSIDPAKWTATSSADVTITEASSQMNFASDSSWNGVLNQANLNSVPVFDFTGKKVEVDIVSTTGLGQGGGATLSGLQMLIQDTGNSGNFVGFYVDQSTLVWRLSNNGMRTDSTAAYSTSDTKWRILHDSVNNEWLFYTFTSGAWTLRFTSPVATWNPTSVRINFGGYIYGSNGVSRTMILDNVTSDATSTSGTPTGQVAISWNTRNRLTSGIKKQSDASDTVEVGQDTVIRIYGEDGTTLLHTETLSAGEDSFDYLATDEIADAGALQTSLTIKVKSTRDAYESAEQTFVVNR